MTIRLRLMKIFFHKNFSQKTLCYEIRQIIFFSLLVISPSNFVFIEKYVTTTNISNMHFA